MSKLMHIYIVLRLIASGGTIPTIRPCLVPVALIFFLAGEAGCVIQIGPSALHKQQQTVTKTGAVAGAPCAQVTIFRPNSMTKPTVSPLQGEPSREQTQEASFAQSQLSSDFTASIGLLISVSQTMREKMNVAMDALQHFINVINPQDEAFLLKFGSRATLLQDFTSDRPLLSDAFQEMHVASSAYPLSRGTKEVLKALPLVNLAALPCEVAEEEQTRDLEGGARLYDGVLAGVCLVKRGKYAKKALLVISDGDDVFSSFSLDDILQEIGAAEIPIYSIAIGDPNARWWGRSWATMDVSTLQTLSERTQGTHFILNVADAAGRKLALTQAMDKITEGLHQPTAEGFTYVFNSELQIFERIPTNTDPKKGSAAP